MENYLYGRLSTLNYLKARRDDASRHHIVRRSADRAIRTIVDQLRDRKLMKLRAGCSRRPSTSDLHAEWMITNQIRAYEKQYFENIEDKEYTALGRGLMKILAVHSALIPDTKQQSPVDMWRIYRPMRELAKHVDWTIDHVTGIIPKYPENKDLPSLPSPRCKRAWTLSKTMTSCL
jgi:hypothetical protein